MKKRILALFLAGAMTLSLAACSGGSGNSTPAPADTTAPAGRGLSALGEALGLSWISRPRLWP